jgi:addiction module HigA family antidote
MTMHNPPHPGEVIRELCLEPLGISVTVAARGLGVTRKTLSELLNGKSGVSPSMALRLAIAFDSTAESWLNMQQQYDLYHARKNPALRRVKRLKAA